MNQYRNHDPMAILLSPEYMKHLSAMTGEDLHGKAEIAEELAARDIQIAKLKRPDFSEMREMLRAMQAGELTVARGIELLEMWSAGNYSDDMLPPVRHDLIEEDSMPVEIINRLKAELVESIEVRTAYLSEIGTMQSELTALKVELARSQADFNDALTELNALRAQPASEPVLCEGSFAPEFVRQNKPIYTTPLDFRVVGPGTCNPQPAQSEPVGVVREAHDGYPWKRISYTSERLLAAAPIGAFVYLTPQPSAGVERLPDLLPVILWLENGCDPKEAAKELRLYDEAMKKGGA